VTDLFLLMTPRFVRVDVLREVVGVTLLAAAVVGMNGRTGTAVPSRTGGAAEPRSVNGRPRVLGGMDSRN
jgi:hypothetical protein